MSGIVVSNHGGRQTDGGSARLALLPKIVDVVGSKISVLFDSGVSFGADNATTVALGAKCAGGTTVCLWPCAKWRGGCRA
jgi:isopentenyl diphosphate isomerase/L-lactate dehydrogenase-like FMN-dependent dehydrogenase